MKIKRWSVYAHISPKGKYYIGITSKKVTQRWGKGGRGYLHKQKNGNYVHTYFANAILKYGWDHFIHEILAENLEETMAKDMEKELISKYKLLNLSYNITDGGDGRLGVSFNHSEESKNLISKNHRRVQSESTKKKISDLQVGKKFPQWRKDLLSNAHNKEKIKVNQLSLEGVLIRSYNSYTEASKITGVSSGNISLACRRKYKTAGGFIWKIVK